MRIILASILACSLTASASSAQTTDAEIGEIRGILQEQIDRHALQSLLVEVRVDGEPVLTEVYGDAMTGVPATLDGRFRNGAVALTYVAALVLRLAEDGEIDIDTPIGRWLPDLPGSDTATILRANLTATGHRLLADPFARWSPGDLIEVSLSTPRRFAPGTNWDYSHSGYVVLGQVLEAATGQPMAELMQDHVLDPLELAQTQGFDTAEIPEPAIHGFTAERGIWEDATYWNPSWTLPEGAIQVTTISEMARSFDTIVGANGFLTAASRAEMIDPKLIGFGSPLEGCPACHELTRAFGYGLGTMLQGDWIFQTPLFGGFASAVATLPEERSDRGRITVAVAVTYTRASVDEADWQAAVPNWADETARLVAAVLEPGNPPPMR